jgi:RND family efflux transporter MFP subunit
MKIIKTTLIVLVLLAIAFTSFSCKSSTATAATTTTRTATVTKGTLTNSITGTGNLAYSTTQDLAFEIAGYVNNVLVSEGDTVKKGQELANLDTTDWENQIKNLTNTLNTAQRNLTAKQRALATAQTTLAARQRAVSNAEFALNQAQIDIDSANYTLNQITEVKNAQDNVDAAQLAFDIAKANHEDSELINNRQQELDTANKKMASILATTDTNLKTSAALAITQAKQAVALKQKALTDDQQAVVDAKANVVNAQLDINDAQLDVTQAEQNITDAQSNLDDAKSKSPIISAPFDGYITSVKVKGGDEVFKGSIGLTIADPNQFQADILVTENDISSVKLDGEATVSLDALSDLTFPAKITWIAPTATISSGVVNYSVTVTLTSLTPTLNKATTAVTTNETQNLKEGLSATVNIITEQKTDVLYVPSKAIISQGPNQTVKVINGTTIETRTVKTGMTDGTNTEITEGLTADEKVTYTATSSSSSSSTSNNNGPSGIQSLGAGGPPPGGF